MQNIWKGRDACTKRRQKFGEFDLEMHWRSLQVDMQKTGVGSHDRKGNLKFTFYSKENKQIRFNQIYFLLERKQIKSNQITSDFEEKEISSLHFSTLLTYLNISFD